MGRSGDSRLRGSIQAVYRFHRSEYPDSLPTPSPAQVSTSRAIGKKRVYVKQALKPTYATEIERGKEVKKLRSKIEALKNVL